MSVRIIDQAGNVLGMLQLSGTILLADLESLRRLGAYRVELIKRCVDGLLEKGGAEWRDTRSIPSLPGEFGSSIRLELNGSHKPSSFLILYMVASPASAA